VSLVSFVCVLGHGRTFALATALGVNVAHAVVEIRVSVVPLDE